MLCVQSRLARHVTGRRYTGPKMLDLSRTLGEGQLWIGLVILVAITRNDTRGGDQTCSCRSAFRTSKIIHSYINSYKISWTDHVRNEEILHIVKEEENILYAIQIRKADWIGYKLNRNCLLRYVIDGKIEERVQVMGRRGGRRKQLLADLKEMRG